MREEETEERSRASDREKVSKGKDFLTLADTVEDGSKEWSGKRRQPEISL